MYNKDVKILVLRKELIILQYISNYTYTRRSLFQDLHRVNLTDEFHVLSLNRDKEGLEFISTLEHKRYPFYGVQFHPEKNLYEWVTGKNIPHGCNATLAAQYFANFFINEGN